VHTTGIDVPQAPGVSAAMTLGKDMTWRDFTQVRILSLRGLLKR